MIAATILAAGESRRMGFPKASLRYRDRTFLETIVDGVQVLGLRPLVVVGDKAVKSTLEKGLSGVTVLVNEEPEAGPIGSIRASIRSATHHPIEALLVWPVDLPHVSLDTVRSLIDGFRHSGHPIVVPEFSGRRGHPVLFARTVFRELLDAPDSEGARAVVRADPQRVLQVAVQDSAVLDRLNTPRAYRDLLRREHEAGG
jgi:molybdenum cofactor cytidylyltransferase